MFLTTTITRNIISSSNYAYKHEKHSICRVKTKKKCQIPSETAENTPFIE